MKVVVYENASCGASNLSVLMARPWWSARLLQPVKCREGSHSDKGISTTDCPQFAPDPIWAGACCRFGMVWTALQGRWEPDKRTQSHRTL